MIHRERDPSLKTYLEQIGLTTLGFNSGIADNWWGPNTETAYRAFLEGMERPEIVKGDGTWGFTLEIVNGDLWANDIVITAFGGANDPQDSGETASGVSTKYNPLIQGVSLPMDGRRYNGLNAAEHRALDGSPFPKMPWGTKVEIHIGGKSLVPSAGIIDLGPGKQASKPGKPHACDLTVAAAKFFNSNASATNFYARGNVRVIDGARYL